MTTKKPKKMKNKSSFNTKLPKKLKKKKKGDKK